MKRFSFSLQRILAFKITLYNKERNTLAQMRAEQNKLEKRKDDTKCQVLQMDADFRQKAANKGVRIDEVRQMAFHTENSEKLVKQLKTEIAFKEAEIEKQLKIVVGLDKEVKSLEKLKEKQWEEYLKETAKEENERILEIVSAQFVKNKYEQDEQANIY